MFRLRCYTCIHSSSPLFWKQVPFVVAVAEVPADSPHPPHAQGWQCGWATWQRQATGGSQVPASRLPRRGDHQGDTPGEPPHRGQSVNTQVNVCCEHQDARVSFSPAGWQRRPGPAVSLLPHGVQSPTKEKNTAHPQSAPHQAY